MTTTAFDLSSTSGSCTTTSGSRSCTLSVIAPIGSDDLLVQTYDASPVNGAIQSTAHLLGRASVSNVSVANGGAATPIQLSVAGQVSNIGVSGGGLVTFAANGSPHTNTFVVNATDFGNQPITGTNTQYANPISVTLSETGGNGHAHLVLNGATVTNASLTSTSDAVAVTYDGGGSAGYYATVTFSANGVTAQNVNIVPMYVSSTAPQFQNGSVNFTLAGQTVTLTISEAQGSLSYTALTPASGSCASAAVSAAPSGSGTSGSVGLTAGTTAATTCSFVISDALGTTYSIPFTTTLTSGGVTIGGVTEYTVTSPSNARLGDMVTGADGAVYVAESIGGNIDRFTTNGSYTQFAVPTPNANPGSLVTASDGAIWFVEKGSYKVGRMTPSGTFTEYSMPNYTTAFPQSLAFSSDGSLYAVDRGNAQVDPLALLGSFGTPIVLSGSSQPTPYGIAADNMGNLYVLDPANNRIAQLSATMNPLYTAIPTANSNSLWVSVQNAGGAPKVWFSETNANAIALDVSGTITEYPIGQNDQPGELTIGPDGNVWFVAPGTNTIGMFNTSTHVFTHYAIPTSSASPMGIATGPDSRVWFTEWNTNKVGAITP